MADEKDEKVPKSKLADALFGANAVADVLRLAGTIAGAITALLGRNKAEVVVAGIAILVASIAWSGVARWWTRRRPAKAKPEPVPRGPKAYLRGLLPFERGEDLLGRDAEAQQILAIVARDEFRFGYLSGEAGVGKTSLLRAGVIPKLEELGWQVVYVPRLADDPRAALMKALRQKLGTEGATDQLETLPRRLARAVENKGIAHLVIIIDQFEELFITHPTRRSREPFLHELGACCTGDAPPASLLVSLRREFVDDLQAFAPLVPQPLDVHSSYRLSSWEWQTALEVLAAAVEHDKVPFAEALMTRLVRDLERGEVVRPVELQLAATRLRDERIYDEERYVSAGSARGILAGYVRESLEPQGAATPELDRQVGRHLLRCLCVEDHDVRRAKGLTLAELRERVTEGLRASGRADMAADADIDGALERVIATCKNRYLLISESEQTYNLAHDYIVGPVRDATAELATAEEQANVVLAQYLQYQRHDRAITLPFRQYRFVRRHASAARRSTAAATELVRRSRRHFVLFVVAPPLVAAAVMSSVAALGWVVLVWRGVRRVERDLTLIRIPAGCFSMGSPDEEAGRVAHEGPRHSVCVPDFDLGRVELTQGQYEAVMLENPSLYSGPRHPVENVSWDDAHKFLRRMNQFGSRTYRLPSEAEWEYADRAGATTAYPWGPSFEPDGCDYANINDRTFREDAPDDPISPQSASCSDGYFHTAPVGERRPNRFGLHDMQGNVWEWVEDDYHPSYAGAPADGSAWRGGGSPMRVVRGGSWHSIPRKARSAQRDPNPRDFHIGYTGFRLAASVSK